MEIVLAKMSVAIASAAEGIMYAPSLLAGKTPPKLLQI